MPRSGRPSKAAVAKPRRRRRRRRRALPVAAASLVTALAGCSSQDTDRAPVQDRDRDQVNAPESPGR